MNPGPGGLCERTWRPQDSQRILRALLRSQTQHRQARCHRGPRTPSQGERKPVDRPPRAGPTRGLTRPHVMTQSLFPCRRSPYDWASAGSSSLEDHSARRSPVTAASDRSRGQAATRRRLRVAIDPSDGMLLGVARYIRSSDHRESAEVAVVVADDWQQRGLCRALLDRLTYRARRAGVRRFSALVGSEKPGLPRHELPADRVTLPHAWRSHHRPCRRVPPDCGGRRARLPTEPRDHLAFCDSGAPWPARRHALCRRSGCSAVL